MRTLLAGLLTVAATAALADFDFDLTAAEVRRSTGHFAVVDLAVGESGLMDRPVLCRDGGGLYVSALQPLTPSIDRNGFSVRREPDGRVSLEVRQESESFLSAKKFLFVTMAGVRECGVYHPYGLDRFQVISIDGAESASELLALPD